MRQGGRLPAMHPQWKPLFLVTLSSLLQTLIFPVAGPLPQSRALFAWCALVPWFVLLLRLPARTGRDQVRLALWSYLCGVLWYGGHCYWVYNTMHQYGGLSGPMAALILLLFCLYLGLYHAVFGAAVAVLRRRWAAQSSFWPLTLAVLWIAVELARAHVTSFPWDLLGYSQIDNAALTAMVPWTGVYGIGFVVALANGLLASGAVSGKRNSRTFLVLGASLAIMLGGLGFLTHAPHDEARASAVLVQPNLNIAQQQRQPSSRVLPLEVQMAELTATALSRIRGNQASVVLWPEAPANYESNDPAFQQTLAALSSEHGLPVIVDANTVVPDARASRRYRLYNSAVLFVPGRGPQQRYDKIHLVPFGEYTPYANLFAFASGLTQEVGTFDRGTDRTPLTDGRHRYGTFICYESIFPDEVLQLVRGGADVLVNLSDDGWYGDTSAPFQHINMARMRAMENRRWLLRDTNSGITAAIDPHGNVRDTIPRHVQTAAVMGFAFNKALTFYTIHGDVFAWLCSAVAAALLALAATAPRRVSAVN